MDEIDLAKELAKQSKLSQETAEEIVRTLFDAITEDLVKKGHVIIPKIGIIGKDGMIASYIKPWRWRWYA